MLPTNPLKETKVNDLRFVRKVWGIFWDFFLVKVLTGLTLTVFWWGRLLAIEIRETPSIIISVPAIVRMRLCCSQGIETSGYLVSLHLGFESLCIPIKCIVFINSINQLSYRSQCWSLIACRHISRWHHNRQQHQQPQSHQELHERQRQQA